MKTYQIDPRESRLGGGWRLRLFEGAEEVGGGAYPPIPGLAQPDFDPAYQDALDEGEDWVRG